MAGSGSCPTAAGIIGLSVAVVILFGVWPTPVLDSPAAPAKR